ncbi:MAG: (d)CMP kinase [Rhodospirillales bacterium]|nr:(d)CMP kinase [Alphaproteobacteria bacterium]MBL6929413.1 (d)CMP kinase [Rhodospirillales bacterium]
MIIAIDGPAASGKGTLARRIAEHLDLALLDTGLLYRAVGLKTVRGGAAANDVQEATKAAETLDFSELDDPELRADSAAAAASKVGAIPTVRQALLDFQRTFAANPPQGRKGAVLDGRDIGTVVCPDADAKIFVTASVEVRAERRVKELRERGLEAIHTRVLQEMKERDNRDASRAVSPLEPAQDAFVLDTGGLDPDAVFAEALNFIRSRCKCD